MEQAKHKKSYAKHCEDCGQPFVTEQGGRKFCPSCRKHRAVAATLRSRKRIRERQAFESGLAKISTPIPFNQLHIAVRRSVCMMETGAAVVNAVRDWMKAVDVPPSLRTPEFKRLQTLLDVYSLHERGGY